MRCTNWPFTLFDTRYLLDKTERGNPSVMKIMRLGERIALLLTYEPNSQYDPGVDMKMLTWINREVTKSKRATLIVATRRRHFHATERDFRIGRNSFTALMASDGEPFVFVRGDLYGIRGRGDFTCIYRGAPWNLEKFLQELIHRNDRDKYYLLVAREIGQVRRTRRIRRKKILPFPNTRRA